MPNLLDQAVQPRIEARVRRLRPDSTRQWGRMTPHQAICHLNDAFKLALDERQTASATGPFAPMLRFIALRVPLPWPKGRLRTVPEAEQGAGGTAPIEFEQDRTELLSLLSRFCSAPPPKYSRTHPIFGPMTAQLWRRWAYLHLDHHLRQFGA
jgi:hypothetical protein